MPGMIKVKRLHNGQHRNGAPRRMNPIEIAVVANMVEKLLEERIAQKSTAGGSAAQLVEEITEWR